MTMVVTNNSAPDDWVTFDPGVIVMRTNMILLTTIATYSDPDQSKWTPDTILGPQRGRERGGAVSIWGWSRVTNVTSVTSWGPLHQTGDKGGCDRLSVSASNVQKEHVQVTSTSNKQTAAASRVRKLKPDIDIIVFPYHHQVWGCERFWEWCPRSKWG